MRVAIHQSHYLPWLAYFDKLARADLFVVLDDVQYTQRGWQNRNKIKTPGGWTLLTVPVSETRGQPILDVPIAATGGWCRSHWKSLLMNYGRAPYFEAHHAFFEELYAARWSHLLELNQHMLAYCRDALGIRTPVVRSSDLRVQGESTTRLIEICRAVGADSYLTGLCAMKSYLDAPAMEAAGIEVVVQRWEAPHYRQQFPGAGFVPDLSIVDLLFNEGPSSLRVLLNEEASVTRTSASDLVPVGSR